MFPPGEFFRSVSLQLVLGIHLSSSLIYFPDVAMSMLHEPVLGLLLLVIGDGVIIQINSRKNNSLETCGTLT